MTASYNWCLENNTTADDLTSDVLQGLWRTALLPLVSQGVLTELTADPATIHRESWAPLLTLVAGGVERQMQRPSSRQCRTPIVSPPATMQERQRARVDRYRNRTPQRRR